MELRYCIFTEKLPERKREDSIMLRCAIQQLEDDGSRIEQCDVPSSSSDSFWGSLGDDPFSNVVNWNLAESLPSRRG